jgi:hypothetical protein
MTAGIRRFGPLDEQILAQVLERLRPWLASCPLQELQARIAGGRLPDLPAGWQEEVRRRVPWAQRRLTLARLLKPRPDLYAALLERLALSGCAAQVELIRRLDGAEAWYLQAMEHLRLQIVAALG